CAAGGRLAQEPGPGALGQSRSSVAAVGSLGTAWAFEARGARHVRRRDGQPLRSRPAARRQTGPVPRAHHGARHRPSWRGCGQCPGADHAGPRPTDLPDRRPRADAQSRQAGHRDPPCPRWMLVLGDSLAGDVVRALEWLGPDLAETTVGKLVGRIGRDDWNAVLETRTHLPAWMVVAIQKGLPASAL